MPSGLFYLNSLDRSISSLRGVWSPCFIEMPVINAASDLGLHCLPTSHLWDARYKWVKGYDNSVTIALLPF